MVSGFNSVLYKSEDVWNMSCNVNFKVYFVVYVFEVGILVFDMLVCVKRELSLVGVVDFFVKYDNKIMFKIFGLVGVCNVMLVFSV